MASLGWTSRYVFGSSSLLALLVAWHSVVFAAQLTLTWTDDSTDAQGISIERSSDTAGAYTQIAITAAGVTSYTDPTVAAGVRYCYRLRAFNASGYSAYSNAACAIPGSTVGLAVIKVGEGDGTVTSAPEGIDCGAICSASYSGGTAVAVTAAATPGSVFTGWTGGGCDGGAEVTCVATLMVSTVVTATFDRAVALVVSTTGAGRGHVTSEPAGIDCGGTCSASYASGTQVTLTATPDAGSAFTGWNDGDCSGTGTCIVAPTAAITVSATFESLGQGADLSVSAKGSPSQPRAGSPVEYGVKVNNLGPATAAGAVLTVNISGLLPGDLASVRAPKGCAQSGSAIRCPLGDLKAGTPAETQISMVPSVAGTIVLTASAASSTPDPVSANNSVTINTVIR